DHVLLAGAGHAFMDVQLLGDLEQLVRGHALEVGQRVLREALGDVRGRQAVGVVVAVVLREAVVALAVALAVAAVLEALAAVALALLLVLLAAALVLALAAVLAALRMVATFARCAGA